MSALERQKLDLLENLIKRKRDQEEYACPYCGKKHIQWWHDQILLGSMKEKYCNSSTLFIRATSSWDKYDF
jgi:hypothetical protein